MVRDMERYIDFQTQSIAGTVGMSIVDGDEKRNNSAAAKRIVDAVHWTGEIPLKAGGSYCSAERIYCEQFDEQLLP